MTEPTSVGAGSLGPEPADSAGDELEVPQLVPDDLEVQDDLQEPDDDDEGLDDLDLIDDES